MTGNRKKAEEFILKYIGKIVTGNENINLYKELFSNMSDKDYQTIYSSYAITTAPCFFHHSSFFPSHASVAISGRRERKYGYPISEWEINF